MNINSANRTKKIREIIVDKVCYQSYPCQHFITVVYSDDSEETLGLVNGQEISETYWGFLSEKNKAHFSEYRNMPELAYVSPPNISEK